MIKVIITQLKFNNRIANYMRFNELLKMHVILVVVEEEIM